MDALGTIAEIWRHPIKSMGGEMLPAATIGPGGIPGDRGWAVFDTDSGDRCSAKWVPRLLLCAARYLEPPRTDTIPHAEFTLPDDTILTTADADASARLSAFLDRSVVLRRRDLDAAGESFFDDQPCHLITTASLEALGAMIPDARVDPRRFRANLIVRTPVDTVGFTEFGWIGRTLAIGGVRMTAAKPVGRCGMTAALQPGLTKDPSILRAITERVDRKFGIYTVAESVGEVRVGDAVVRA